MLWLALDGALGAFSASLVASDETAPAREASAAGNDALERGLTVLDEVLAGSSLSEVGALAVGTGPGGFTGLRIALSYAKGLAFATGLPLVGVSSYDALEPAGAAGIYATFVHGRPGIACLRLRGSNDDFTLCGAYEALAEGLSARFPRGTELICYGSPQGAASALGERGIIVRAMPPQPGVPALAIARRAILRGVAGDAHALVADYGEAHYAERQVGPGRSASGT
jgi:tRNA A37 threonylcarbamoyladenosine modification protein TsaB